ncbi:MAG: hypothetical protein JXA23_08285 [Bacteroidales bacterium]|nr:hypothetical protein [Bacteroidales bacterium]
MKNNLLRIVLAGLLIADICFSFIQHANMPVTGDLAEVAFPDKGSAYYHVLQDPVGLSVLIHDTLYANPNRYFSHLWTSAYMLHVPKMLQTVADPVESIYLACGVIKILIQAGLLLLFATYISNSFSITTLKWLTAAVLVTPLFQASGYNSYMGFIDQSITYNFFYSLPLMLLLLFFLPYYRAWYNQTIIRMSNTQLILWAGLTFILCFSGPLVPGILAIICPLILLGYLYREFRDNPAQPFGIRVKHAIISLNKPPFIILFLTILLSLYSLYIGSFNILNRAETLSLTDLYGKLSLGIFHQFTDKAGFPLAFLVIAINLILLARMPDSAEKRGIFTLTRWLLLFSILFILLLPLGGYRLYRPQILRYDTVMPITAGIVLLFGISSHYLIFAFQGIRRYLYVAIVGLILAVFTRADIPMFYENDCEEKCLYEIASATDTILILHHDCPVMEWGKISDYRMSAANARLLNYWGVTKRLTYYYQEE